jgi:hypothetical protein
MRKKSEEVWCIPRATKGRGFIAPQFSEKARKFVTFIGGWYLRIFEGVSRIEMEHEQVLIDELESFFRKNQRLIIAFRHVAKEDAPVLMYTLNRKINRKIKERNKQNVQTEHIIPHAQFLYGSDVLEWAGKAAAWIFPKIGCIPVQNRGRNKNGLNLVRREMQTGNFPIALAPEGQVTYHMYHCSPLSPGIASLAVWGAEHGQDVTILPVSIGYQYAHDQEFFIRSVLSKWELKTGKVLAKDETTPIHSLLIQATEITIELLEKIYGNDDSSKDGASLYERMQHICIKALEKAERIAQIIGEGSIINRLYTLRYLGVEAIHPDQHQLSKLSQVEKSIADLKALEAHAFLCHTQVVDVLEYINPEYISPSCSIGRYCEYALNLLDVINRLQGGNIDTRYSPHRKKACVHIGYPIRVSSILSSHAASQRKVRLKAINHSVFEALQRESEELEKSCKFYK